MAMNGVTMEMPTGCYVLHSSVSVTDCYSFQDFGQLMIDLKVIPGNKVAAKKSMKNLDNMEGCFCTGNLCNN